MDIQDFFKFGSKLVSTTFQAHPVGLRGKTEKVQDDVDNLITGEYNSIAFPVVFKQAYGKKLLDVLDTGWAGLYLISDRVKIVLEQSQLTGWKTFPIRLLDKRDIEIEGYRGFSVTGRCGPIDTSKSEIIQKKLVPNGPLSTLYRGYYVGLDEWDGSDFFLPKYYYGTITTAKAAKVIKSNKLTNVKLINLAEIEIMKDTAELLRSKQP